MWGHLKSVHHSHQQPVSCTPFNFYSWKNMDSFHWYQFEKYQGRILSGLAKVRDPSLDQSTAVKDVQPPSYSGRQVGKRVDPKKWGSMVQVPKSYLFHYVRKPESLYCFICFWPWSSGHLHSFNQTEERNQEISFYSQRLTDTSQPLALGYGRIHFKSIKQHLK